MVRDRKTKIVGIRIPDRPFEAIEAEADMRGMTLLEYVRSVLEAQDELPMELVARQLKGE